MEQKNIPLVILGVVAIIAVVGLVLMLKGGTGMGVTKTDLDDRTCFGIFGAEWANGVGQNQGTSINERYPGKCIPAPESTGKAFCCADTRPGEQRT